MQIQNSFELLCFLKQKGYLKENAYPLWWQNAGNFEIIIGAILVQNTQWKQAFKVLERLREKGILNLLALSEIPQENLAFLMQDLGFFRQKSQRIRQICSHILQDFGDFECFKQEVDRKWLLSQKGIGNETCDSILCYGALREEMVADKYTAKLLRIYGYEFEDYTMLKEWLVSGILEHYQEVCELYKEEIPLSKLYARFHGKIVEYCKENKI